MNKNKLRAKMALHGDTAGCLAKALSLSQQRFSAKINGKGDFTQSEIFVIKDRYNLTADEINDIFFDKEVSLKDTN